MVGLCLPLLPGADRTYWKICEAMQAKSHCCRKLSKSIIQHWTVQVTRSQRNKKQGILTSLGKVNVQLRGQNEAYRQGVKLKVKERGSE